MPCWELFEMQSQEYKLSVFPEGVPVPTLGCPREGRQREDRHSLVTLEGKEGHSLVTLEGKTHCGEGGGVGPAEGCAFACG